MKVYIIRHGETSWNTEYRMQGRSDVELNENGIRLAKITAENMKDIPFDICFSSPSVRAVHTAEIVLGDRNAEIRKDPRLYEIDFGVWEGKTLHPDHPDMPRPKFLSLGAEAFEYEPPEGGEKLQDVIARCGEFYNEMVSDPELQDKTVLISAHGCPCRALLYQVCEDKNDFWRGKVPPNCAVTILDIQNGKAVVKAVDRIYYPADCVIDYYKVAGEREEKTHENK